MNNEGAAAEGEAADITSCLCTESAVSSWHEGRPRVNVNILNKQRWVERRLGGLCGLLKSAAESGHHSLSVNP